MEVWTGRIFEAIDSGFAMSANGQRIPLDNKEGIDVLANMVENSSLSPNADFYGRLHIEGHQMIGYIHDPDNSFLEGFGVIADNTTSMRDPAFFRWHQHVDDIFERHKRKFRPYTASELSNPNIEVNSIDISLNRAGASNNVLLTFWQRSQVDLGIGLDFGPDGNAFVTFTHIQHAPFSYQIKITNNSRTPKRGTVRIFLGPTGDQNGKSIPIQQKRRWMLELDKFAVNLNPGVNNVVRRSEQSNLTIPYERTFRNVAASTQPESDQFRFCNCGWPSHMLIPKGTPQGTRFDLFVMVSNYNDDVISPGFDENIPCDDAHTFCGLRDRLYPDARSMGFPFDRLLGPSVNSLEDFAKPYKNMALNQVLIRFTNTVIARS